MSKGFLITALNGKKDYLKMARALAMSISQTQKEKIGVTLITDISIDKTYNKIFDNVISIDSDQTRFNIKVRSMLYDLTPYDETLVLDTDMLVLNDLTNVWNACRDKDLLFCDRVTDYRGKLIERSIYKNQVIENNLSSIYSALHYFKKSEIAKNFYELVKIINENWKEFYAIFIKNHTIVEPSMDVTSAIAIEMLDIKNDAKTKSEDFSFVHMKTELQGWKMFHETWLEPLAVYFHSIKEFKIGNYKQQGIFHYVESNFLSDEILTVLEKNV